MRSRGVSLHKVSHTLGQFAFYGTIRGYFESPKWTLKVITGTWASLSKQIYTRSLKRGVKNSSRLKECKVVFERSHLYLLGVKKKNSLAVLLSYIRLSQNTTKSYHKIAID